MQNLENKRSNLRLCARSLSLQDLHAKSREHGSYGGRDEGRFRFGTELVAGARPLDSGRIGGFRSKMLGQVRHFGRCSRDCLGQVVKDRIYPVDNVS